MKKILKILYIVFFLCLILSTKSKASTKLTGIENFPSSYQPYLYELKKKYPHINKDNIDEIIKTEVGKAFITGLEHAGVYKRDAHGMAAFDRFMETI